MEKLFWIATSASGPLALAGFFAAATFFIFRQILAKNIFPKMSETLGSQIIRSILDKLFYLSLVAMLLGFIGYVAKPLLDKLAAGPTAAERMAAEATTLSGGLSNARLIALTKLGQIQTRSKDEVETLTRILEGHIQRLGAARTPSGTSDGVVEMGAAFHVLGGVLQRADQLGLAVRRPEFNALNAAKLDLSHAYLRGATFSDSTLSEVLMNNAMLKEVRLIGVKARAIMANHADISDALIQETCMEEGGFSQTNFDKTQFKSSDLNNANFKRANMSLVVMDNTRLSQASFQGSDLQNADFTGALELGAWQVQEGTGAATAKLPSSGFQKSHLSVCRR